MPNDPPETDLVSLYVTVGTMEDARGLADRLLEARLVACVNAWPIRSFYRWKGETKDAEEVALWIKTTRARRDEAIRVIAAAHPYEVPCVEAFDTGPVHPPFGAWVHDETRPM